MEFARNNEEFAEDIREDYPAQKNWIVTVQFYSFLHYVEERLKSHSYTSTNHDDRMDNIRNCPHVDTKAYKIYKSLYDTSRDARYECMEIEESDIIECEKRLEKGKRILGFRDGSTNTKYST